MPTILGPADWSRAPTSRRRPAPRLVVAETTGGKGGFIYQQDTGALYYSTNGNFAGGGTMVGAIDGSGGTPWVYNASSFVQV
jgi:hypothetical protein